MNIYYISLGPIIYSLHNFVDVFIGVQANFSKATEPYFPDIYFDSA